MFQMNTNMNFPILFPAIIIWIILLTHVYSLNISFTKPVYNVGIYQDQDIRKYVTHYDFQMGIRKPDIDGHVDYKIRDSSEIFNTFEAESLLIGDFYYLRIRTKYSANINRETTSMYNLTVSGLFEYQSDQKKIIETKTQVIVKILDKNDNCPLFTKEKFEFTIYGNISLAHQIGTVVATDADDGINGEIFYYSDTKSLQSELQKFPFSINPFSGIIYPTQKLFEFTDQKLMGKVFAIHRGDLSLITCDSISHAQISISILSDNLHPPKIEIAYLKKYFDPLLDDFSYAEISVSDEDDRLNPPRNSYPIYIKSSSLSSLYLFFVPTGKINNYILKLRSLYPFTADSVTVIIEAQDLGLYPKKTNTQLTIPLSQFREINILSVPNFVQLTIPENSIVNSSIFLLRTIINSTNEKNLSKLKFSLVPDVDGAFLIGDLLISPTGVVSISRALNAEDYGSRKRKLSVAVSLTNAISEKKTLSMLVFIEDVNEFPPVVNNNGSVVFIKESAKIGETILTIDAYDPDISRTQLTYYLYDEEYLPFQLHDVKKNTLIIKDKLDAETMPGKFQVIILVTDSGKPLPKKSIAFYEVELMDVNEFKPEFLYKSCNIIISRDTPYDYRLGHFIAEDLDRDRRDKVRISIASVSIKEPCFFINSQTGTLVLLCSLRNRILFKVSNFTIQLKANDSHFSSLPLTLNFTVVEPNSRFLAGNIVKQDCMKNDIYKRMQENFNLLSKRNQNIKIFHSNEISPFKYESRKPPKFVTVIPKNIHLREELPMGYVVQTLVVEKAENGRDPYESEFVFGLWVEEDSLAFSVRKSKSNEVQIIVADRLDRETLSKYSLTIAVCDQGKPQYCTFATMSIQIEDINDNKPRFVDSFQLPIELPENYEKGKKIIQIEATDADPYNVINYRLLNLKSVFRIHKRTGWLRLRTALDREQMDKYQLIIIAFDQIVNSKSLTSTLTLNIVVTDVNDNKPTFAKNIYILSVPEDLPVGSFLVQLYATDLDEGLNSQLRFWIYGINSECFKCHEVTGTVHLLCKLSSTLEFRLIAVVKDSGKPQSYSSQADLKIFVQRIKSNRYISSLKEPLVHAYIKENSVPGTLVATIRPENPDNILNKFVYTIGGQSSGISEFQINNEGEIRTVSNIDRERQQSYWLFIYIEDRNDEMVHKILSEVYVEIIDENDNYPMPDKAFYKTSVMENLQGVHHLITIMVHDYDVTNNTIFKYKIISGDPMNYFSVKSSGQIFTTEKLINRESPHLIGKSQCAIQDFYDLKIMISDSGSPERVNTVNVHINIIDINDNSPSFINNNKFLFNRYLTPELIRFHQSNNCNFFIGRVTATDMDYDINGTVRYTLLTPRSVKEVYSPNNRTITDLFSLDAKTGHLFVNVCRPVFENWLNRSIWNYDFSLKIWAFDLGIPTLWSSIPASVTVRLIRSANSTLKKTDSNKPKLYFAYQLPETVSMFYDDCVGYEILPIPIVDSIDPRGTSLELKISDVNGPFSILRAQTVAPARYETKAILVIAESLVNCAEKTILTITIRNEETFLEHNLTIFVKFYNKNAPVFQSSIQDPLSIFIDDHEKVPKLIYKARATVPILELPTYQNSSEFSISTIGSDSSEPILYSICASNDPETVQKLFYLHSNNGDLHLISSANNYRNQTLELIIEARSKKAVYMKLNIHIIDTNNMHPEFLVSQENCNQNKEMLRNMLRTESSTLSDNEKLSIEHHLENSLIISLIGIDRSSNVGTLITSVSASDQDSGDNGKLIYQIQNDSSVTQYFQIDSNNGDIRLRRNLNSIPNRIVFITVVVNDNGHPVLMNRSVVGINIHDNVFSQNQPQLEKSDIDLIVMENVTINTIIHCLKLQSYNPLKTTAQFLVISSQPTNANLFSVTRTTGCIITVGILDRERIRDMVTIVVQVQSYNGLTSKYNSIVSVKIHIIDVNDNPPRFKGPLKLFGVISESANPRSVVVLKSDKKDTSLKALVIETEDPDEGVNGQIDFIIHSDQGHYFRIDQHTGVLSLAFQIDREIVGTTVNLLVELKDQGVPSLRCQEFLEIIITIQDENDNPPKFEKNFYIQNLILPTFANAPLIQLRTIDPDLDPKISYSIISGNNARYFSIHPNNGWLTISSDRVPLSSQLSTIVIIYVVASDGKYDTKCNVTITSYDDTHTQILPLEKTAIMWFIPENRINIPDLLLPRTRLSQFSHQMPEVRYVLLNEHPSISLDQTSGSLKLISAIDREKYPYFYLLVLARGWDGSHTYINITVNVTDENDFKPLFLSDQYEFLVHINSSIGTQSIKLKAIDMDAGDNGTVQYSIYFMNPHTYDLKFNIDSSTGLITLQEGPTENLLGKRFTLRVKANDKGQPSHSSFTNVIIDVVSSKTPLFEHRNYSVFIPEDSVKDKVVTTVRASSNSGHTILYTISDGNEDELFELDFAAGIIRLVGTLDYETKTNHSLVITATDPSSSLSHSTTIIINVVDCPDEYPIFSQVSFSVSISENLPVKYEIIKIVVLPQRSNHKRVEFSIKDFDIFDSCSSNNFKIDKFTGIITLRKLVDFEKCMFHEFWIEARYEGGLFNFSRVPIQINILDENDNPPKFIQPSFNIILSLDTPSNSLVAVALATDLDSNSELVYKTLNETYNIFKIDKSSGFIYFNPRPGFKKLLPESGMILFQVLVHDYVHSTVNNATVQFIHTKNHAPFFTTKQIHMVVPENATVKTKIGKLVANDIDKDKFAMLQYRIIGGFESDKFYLDSKTGEITLKEILDREARSRYELRVVVYDGGSQNDFADVLIHVTDVNDNVPIMDQLYYEVTVILSSTQTRTVPQMLLQLHARDKDQSPRFRMDYRLVFPMKADSPVTLDSITGQMFLKTTWKFPTLKKSFNVTASTLKTEFHRLLVQVCEEPILSYRLASTSKTSCGNKIPVTINIVFDAQKQNPVITCSVKTVSENNVPNQLVALCHISPPDIHGKWSLIPSDSANETQNYFDIDPEYGYIKAKRVMDYEIKSQYRMQVEFRVQDSQYISTKSIVIDLTDVNDCYPIFDNSEYSISMPENLSPESKVIQCKAVDLDFKGKDKIIYSITQLNKIGSQVSFRIDEEGWVYLTSSLDYEKVKMINLIISASDKKNHMTNTSLMISVIDVNDEIPYWIKNPPKDEVELMENCKMCTREYPKVLYRLDARDNDTESQEESIKFLITNQNSNPYLVHFLVSDIGEVLLLKPLDAERISGPLELKFLAFDRLHYSNVEFILTIKIIDVNDHVPVCPQVLDLRIPEGVQPGTVITQLQAYDRDSKPAHNTLTYKLIECSDPFLLIVERNTGKIIINAPLDREFSSIVNFVVNASDPESKSCSFKVKVIILDINDNEPRFTHTKIAPLPENAPLGSVVGKINAVDMDAGLNRKIIYRILNDSKSSFSIDKHTGIVRVVGILDREKQSEHQIVVEAADCGTPSKISIVKVNISLLDVNDSPPQFLNVPLKVNVSEDIPLGSLIMTIKAVSEDLGINAIVSYRIVIEQDQFVLNSSSGDLILTKKLDYEKNQELFLTVEASDMGSPSLSTSTVIVIQINDVNDNFPLFSENQYTFSLVENSPVGKVIGKVSAFDADTHLNGKIIYSLTYWSPNHKWTNRSLFNHIDHFFGLEKDTGEIFLKFSPDREEQSVYKFQVSAIDQGNPPLSSTTSVLLEIEDMNDNPPIFSKDSYRFLIQVDRNGVIPEQELKKNGDLFEVGRMSVSDKDGPTNSKPFQCKLFNSEIASQFSMKTDEISDECIILVNGSLYLGVRNLLAQVNDNSATTLYRRVRIIVDIIRLSNIPPEIEPLNATYIYYHSSDWMKKDSKIAKVLVRDRSPAYDMLKFELIFNSTNSQNRYLKDLFTIDAFTGLITTKEQLDSGLYSLDVRVTNGSLSAERTIFLKIVVLTKEMADSACIIQISYMKPKNFFSRKLDEKLINFLKTAMVSKLAYIISVKSVSKRLFNRKRRQSEEDDSIDVLVALYNENENRFFKSNVLVSKITSLIKELKILLDVPSLTIFDSICNDKYICVHGQCRTNIMIKPNNSQIHFQVQGVTFSSMDFSYESSCKCSVYFGGSRCEIPLNKCAHNPCESTRICRPKPTRSPGFVCDCPAFKSGKDCEKVLEVKSSSSCSNEQCMLARESGPIHFTGGGFLRWTLGEKHNNLRIDISFSFRLIQKPAALMEINWNSLRSVSIDVDNDGKILITADHKTIPPIYLYESRNLVADEKWHNIRLSIIGVANIPGWWLHVVLDEILSRSLSLESWSEGDPFNQSILLAAKSFHTSYDLEKSLILNETMTGCIKNVILNGQKLPYQQLSSMHLVDNIQVQSRNLNYGCPENLLRSPCAMGLCKNGGLCLNRNYDVDSIKSYECHCQDMFSGKHCENINSPCTHFPCLHDGKCIETDNGYKCICPDGLFGSQCQWGKGCSPSLNPCPTHASCIEQKGSGPFSNAICRCPATMQGYLCQFDVDECQIKPPVCQIGRGLCHNTFGNYQCNCSLGYGGRHCETNSLSSILPDTSTFGLTQYHIYIIVGLLACLFVLALLTVVVLVLRIRPINVMNSEREKDGTTALSLDPIYQYKVYSGDQCSRYSPNNSMMTSSIHHPSGYIGGFMIEPPSTPSGRSHRSFHQAQSSQYEHLSQEAIDRVSLFSSTNDIVNHKGPMPLSQNNKYIRSSRGQIYHNIADSRQKLSHHSSTFSLVPCNVGPQQHLHLVPNKNSVLFCPVANHPRLVYEPMVLRNSNLSLHTSHAASTQWEPNENQLDDSAMRMIQSTCFDINQSHAHNDISPVNGELDRSMMSWNGQYGDDGLFHKEMISSQEMSLTDTTDRSTAHLLPKITPNRINYKMQPPVIHQINISKPTVLANQNGKSDSPNTVSPSTASIPSGTSSDTRGTMPDCKPNDVKKKINKISPDSNSGEGTECDTEDLELDHQLICPTIISSNNHLQEDAEDGLSSVPLLDSIN